MQIKRVDQRLQISKLPSIGARLPRDQSAILAASSVLLAICYSHFPCQIVLPSRRLRFQFSLRVQRLNETLLCCCRSPPTNRADRKIGSSEIHFPVGSNAGSTIVPLRYHNIRRPASPPSASGFFASAPSTVRSYHPRHQPQVLPVTAFQHFSQSQPSRPCRPRSSFPRSRRS